MCERVKETKGGDIPSRILEGRVNLAHSLSHYMFEKIMKEREREREGENVYVL